MWVRQILKQSVNRMPNYLMLELPTMVCFIASVGNQKPNANQQIICLLFLMSTSSQIRGVLNLEIVVELSLLFFSCKITRAYFKSYRVVRQ